MYIFWILALLPICIGGFLFLKTKTVIWQEWLISALIALIMAGAMHAYVINSQIGDTETWSGQVISARYIPKWKEYYETERYRTEYYTDANGKEQSRQVFDGYDSHTRWHDEEWHAETTLSMDVDIIKSKYIYITNKFKDSVRVKGDRTTMAHASHMLEGDPYDYFSENRTGWIEPVTESRSFENRLKANSTVFSFVKVPTNILVYEYPKNTDMFRSDRLLGISRNYFNLLSFDQLNAKLGPVKKVNLIFVGFPTGTPREYGEYQQAKWLGGKKNDLVIAFAGGPIVEWVKCFGWTEKEIVKRNIESIFTENKLYNKDFLSKIEAEVRKNYLIKDWSKFDYISIEPPLWSYIVYIILLLVIQTGLYIYFHVNENDKENGVRRKYNW